MRYAFYCKATCRRTLLPFRFLLFSPSFSNGHFPLNGFTGLTFHTSYFAFATFSRLGLMTMFYDSHFVLICNSLDDENTPPSSSPFTILYKTSTSLTTGTDDSLDSFFFFLFLLRAFRLVKSNQK